MEKIIIIGGKGAAIVLADQILHAKQHFNAKYDVIGYSIDDPLLGSEINGIPILCKIKDLASLYNDIADVRYFFALYKPTCMQERVNLFKSLSLPERKFINFIHPLAFVAPSVTIGTGNVVCSNTTINCNARIGNFNTFNGNILFGHDSVLGDYNILAGSATVSSEVIIGNGNFVGLNSTIRDRIKIGDYNIIGMSAAILHDIESNTTLIGNPAQVLKK